CVSPFYKPMRLYPSFLPSLPIFPSITEPPPPGRVYSTRGRRPVETQRHAKQLLEVVGQRPVQVRQVLPLDQHEERAERQPDRAHADHHRGVELAFGAEDVLDRAQDPTL